MKSLFPSLIQSLVKPNTKQLKNGLHFTMSTSMHSEGTTSKELMGLNSVEVTFIIQTMNVLEPIIFHPSGKINWLEAGNSLYKIFPSDKLQTPTFKQIFSYLGEAVDNNNTEAIESITKEFAETIFMMDFDDNNEYFLLPEEMIMIDIPTGIRKKLYL